MSPVSTIVWRDFRVEPPLLEGHYLVILQPTRPNPEGEVFPVEAQRWILEEGSSAAWIQSEGERPIEDSRILWWSEIPAVRL